MLGGRISLLFELIPIRMQRLLDDRACIAIRNLMSQQLLQAAQVVVRLLVARESEFVELRRQRPHD